MAALARSLSLSGIPATPGHYDVLEGMQNIHDSWNVREWPGFIAGLARTLGLMDE